MLQFDLRITVKEIKGDLDESISEFDYDRGLATYLESSLVENIEEIFVPVTSTVREGRLLSKEERGFEFSVSIMKPVR
jgi:hypothetical protein